MPRVGRNYSTVRGGATVASTVPCWKANLPLRTWFLVLCLMLVTTISSYFRLDWTTVNSGDENKTSLTNLLLREGSGLIQPTSSPDSDHATDWDNELQAAKAYVRSFRKVGKNLLFFHIPKTAGTAVESAAGTQKVPWGSCLFRHKPKRETCRYPGGEDWPIHVGWWHVPAYLFPIVKSNPYRNAELFGIIRHPYDRMVSEFYYICTLKVFEWRPDQCDRSRLFDKAYMNEWLIRKLVDREKNSGLAYLTDNGHFTPQSEFIFSPNQVRVLDYVLRMDGNELSQGFSKLMHHFGLDDIQLKKLNALGAKERKSDTHLGVEDLNATTLQLINEIYDHDFAYGAFEMHEVIPPG